MMGQFWEISTANSREYGPRMGAKREWTRIDANREAVGEVTLRDVHGSRGCQPRRLHSRGGETCESRA